MSKRWNNIRIWCNENQGLFAFLTLIATVIAIIPYNKIDLGFAIPIWDEAVYILKYKIQIPLYSLLLIGFVGLLYFNKVKNKYKEKKIDIDFLVGFWKNEWDINGANAGSEQIEIKKDGSYIRNDEHIFNVENISYDFQKNQISFTKVSARPPEIDNRRPKNTLDIINNDLLIGKENGYDIKYTRISV